MTKTKPTTKFSHTLTIHVYRINVLLHIAPVTTCYCKLAYYLWRMICVFLEVADNSTMKNKRSRVIAHRECIIKRGNRIDSKIERIQNKLRNNS